jgi:2-oxoglutarate ferredoxin oxidoreductase subunit gamma
MADYHEVAIAGIGGQGALTIGRLLAEAAATQYPYVSYFPNYGASMRGGDTECTVILSRQPIGAPAMLRPHAAILMGDMPLQEYRDRVVPGGLVMVDSSLLPGKVGREDLRVLYIPASDTAIGLGNRQVANLVLLGAYLETTGAVSLEAVEAALEQRLSGGRREGLLELNRQALREGARLAREAHGPG